MSKFLKKIAELTGSSPDPSVIAQIRKKKLDNEKDPTLPALTSGEQKAIAAADEVIKQTAADSEETLAKLRSSTDVDSEALTEQGPDDFIPRQGPPSGGEFEPAIPPPGIGGPPVPQPVVEPAEPLTTEGETFI